MAKKNVKKSLSLPNREGRPNSEIEMEKLEGICQFKPTIQWAADFFKVHPNTIQNFVQKNTGLTWTQFRDRCMAPTRFALIQAAVDRATKQGSDKALAMCLREFCDWDTKRGPEIQINANSNLTNEQLDARILELLKSANIEL